MPSTVPASGPDLIPPADLPEQVFAALREDIGGGDITAQLVPEDQRVRGRVVTRQDAILCGRPWADEIFRRLYTDIRLTWRAKDGERVAAGAVIFEIEGRARPILTGERTALNFLQLLSATATQASRFAAAIAGTGCTVIDTARPCPACARRRSMRCGAVAAAITAWVFTTWCSSRKTTSPPRARSAPRSAPRGAWRAA